MPLVRETAERGLSSQLGTQRHLQVQPPHCPWHPLSSAREPGFKGVGPHSLDGLQGHPGPGKRWPHGAWRLKGPCSHMWPEPGRWWGLGGEETPLPEGGTPCWPPAWTHDQPQTDQGSWWTPGWAGHDVTDAQMHALTWSHIHMCITHRHTYTHVTHTDTHMCMLPHKHAYTHTGIHTLRDV